jgi:serine/threonine-protein kinase
MPEPAEPGPPVAVPTDRLAALRAEQAERWRAGDPVPAEALLAKAPGLPDDDALVLINGEALLRRERGEKPTAAEYRARFPHLAEFLAVQFEVEAALGGSRGGQRTVAYVPAEVPERPRRLALARGAGPQPTTDLKSLLHKRLRFLASLFAGGMAVVVLLVISWPGTPWYATAIYCLVFVESAAVAGLLWKQVSLSLLHLRAIELILFGTLYAFWALTHAAVYPHFQLSEPPIWFASVMAAAICLPWVFMILLYGIFIPNTWRRCAAVVGTAAAIPPLISLITGIAEAAAGDNGPEHFWVPMAVWMASAAACAVYGSHRIEILRQEVSEARKLGQYVLKQRLGSGGMGEVYLAEHVLLKRPCAVKLIHPERAGDPRELGRFEREVRATAALTHPNTVQVFDYGRADDGTFYYAMEYLPGLGLQELVERHGPLPPGRAIHLLRQLCGALAEAHAAGLIHRDVKPGNVIVCQRGGRHDVAKLLDFGLVRPPAGPDSGPHLTLEGSITGTPAYMSPEQAGGKGDLDGRSDVYSLGALAYFLLTGRAPFEGRTMVQTLAAHLYETPALPAGAPEDLGKIVLRCLAKDPTERFPDVSDLDRALAGCEAAGRWGEPEAAAWWQERADLPRPRG